MSRSTTDPASAPQPGTSHSVTDVRSRLNSESEKNQLQLVQQLAELGEEGLVALMEFLVERQNRPANIVDGKAYQALFAANASRFQEFRQKHFQTTLVPTPSAQGIDYASLEDLLIRQDFQEADRMTLLKLCELAGEAALSRKWLYFTEVESFPTVDLQTLNTLWLIYSEGKFGFSVQREIWLGTGKNWEKFWPKIGWKTGNNWTRYPQEFTWNLTAPKGHLPLSNQLRGVRVIASLLAHPAWS